MAEPRDATTEYHDEYSETLGMEFRKLEDALLSDTVSVLAPREPIRLDETALIEEALTAMMAHDCVAVLAVDGEGRLSGIVTDRDVLGRVCAAGREAGQTRLAEVMTRDPEALRPDDLLRGQPDDGHGLPNRAGRRRRTAPRRDRHRRRHRQVAGRALPGSHPQPAAGRPAEAASRT